MLHAIFGNPRLISWLITFCGIIAILTPLALWVAWSVTVFYLVLIVGFSAILAVAVLAHFAPD